MTQLTPAELTADWKAEARRLGFVLAGACPAATPGGYHRLLDWLARGYGGELHYLAHRAAAYEHPRSVLPGVRSLLMLGLPYATEPAGGSDLPPGSGRVSRYAWGARDYHDVIHERLRRLIAWLRQVEPRATARGVVDTAPLLEREFAQLAGLGWIGKHTLLLNRQQGSWFFLAAVLTDLELAYDEPFDGEFCGSCRACLDVCPTAAFPAPYVLDARRCISYLTIELRGLAPPDQRERLDGWLFGCDLCQDVCPWNRRVPVVDEPAFQPVHDLAPAQLVPLFGLSDDAFRTRFRPTPLWRAKRRGLLRNAALLLGGRRDHAATAALAKGLHDAEPLVRAACAWALRRLDNEPARTALRLAVSSENDPLVRAELPTEGELTADAP